MDNISSEVFEFGKYRGKTILEVSDLEYTKWYAGATGSVSAVSFLEQNNYTLVKGTFVKAEEKEKILEKIETLEKIEIGEISTYSVFFRKNFNEIGCYFDEITKTTFELEEKKYSVNYYGGFAYSYPIVGLKKTTNSRGIVTEKHTYKRVKGKDVKFLVRKISDNRFKILLFLEIGDKEVKTTTVQDRMLRLLTV